MKSPLDFLEKIVSFQTISTDKSKRQEILACIHFLKNFLKQYNFRFQIIGQSHPLFLAYRFISNRGKTIGVYSHYDVQPPEPLNEWQSNPFKLTIKNNKIYGRGTADDKGHLTQNIFSVISLIQEKKLKNNIVFLFEGEEEIGSVNFSQYLNEAKRILKNVDFYIVTDVGMVKKNKPTIYYALRGIIYFELEIWTGKRDLHSGVYGNLVYNPAQIASQLLTKMRDLQGEIKIPGFYKQVRKINRKEKMILLQNEKNLNEIKKISGAFELNPLLKNFPSISAKIYPSMEINGIYSGYTKEGVKTIIPNYALIKFSFRLVEFQDPKAIIKLVKNFIKQNIPAGVKYNLKILASASPFYSEYKHPYVIKIAKILENSFKNSCVFNREGGSIPVAEILMRNFKKPIILTGFTLPGSNIHSPNENIDLNLFFKGINVLKEIYSSDY